MGRSVFFFFVFFPFSHHRFSHCCCFLSWFKWVMDPKQSYFENWNNMIIFAQKSPEQSRGFFFFGPVNGDAVEWKNGICSFILRICIWCCILCGTHYLFVSIKWFVIVFQSSLLVSNICWLAVAQHEFCRVIFCSLWYNMRYYDPRPVCRPDTLANNTPFLYLPIDQWHCCQFVYAIIFVKPMLFGSLQVFSLYVRFALCVYGFCLCIVCVCACLAQIVFWA